MSLIRAADNLNITAPVLKKKSSFISDLFAVFRSKAAMIIFGLGVNIITARFLGPAANGVIAALTVYPLLFMNFGSLGIQQSTTYFVGQGKHNLQDIYGGILIIWIFTSIFCLLSCYFLIHFFTKGSYPNAFIFLAIISIPFSLYNTYSSGLFLGNQNIKEFNKINWLPAAFNFFFTFLLVAVFKLGITGSMLGSFLGVFLLSFFVLVKVRKIVAIKPSFDIKLIKEMISLGIIYALSYLVTFLNYRLDIVLLEKWSNAYEVGIYSKGAVVVEYLWQIPLLLSTLIFSRSANAKDSQEFSVKACRLLRFAAIAIFIAIFLLYFMSGFLVVFLFGTKFIGSVTVLKILMPGVFLLTIFRVLNMDIAGRGKPWLSMIAMLPAVIINIILNYFFIPEYGANGSAFASTISYSFAAITFLIIYSKEVKIPVSAILKFTKEDKNLLDVYYKKLVSNTTRFRK